MKPKIKNQYTNSKETSVNTPKQPMPNTADTAYSTDTTKENVDYADTVIIGAGASGLFCAMQMGQAYQKAGLKKRILVLDHANKAGKKILMSGGGKCNFTNMVVEPENYISHNPHFCKSALSRYTNWDFIALVAEHGIAYEERKHGQLFCLNSAKDILNMLLAGCAKYGVSIFCNTQVKNITAKPAEANAPYNFSLETEKKHKKSSSQKANIAQQTNLAERQYIYCKNLIVATGGLSIPSMGATGFSYSVAEQFGHSLLPRHAGLVPFTFTDTIGNMCKTLAGNAIDVIASNEKASFSEAMLFTHRGLSGPVMLQLSNYWQLGESIVINLIPQEDMAHWLIQQKQLKPKPLLRTLLISFLPKSLVLALEAMLWQDIAEKPLADIAHEKLHNLGNVLNNWQIKPSGTEGYRTAEVTLGGVCVDEVSSKTMESKRQANLYFIGEALDVTGWLGGYNFQWAWASADACANACVKSAIVAIEHL